MLTRSEESKTEKLKPRGGHERYVKAHEGHEGEVKAQGGQEEDANSPHEESHVSNRHMDMVAQRMVGPSQQRTTPADGARTVEECGEQPPGAAQEVRETGKGAGEEREHWKTERKESNTLHLVFHFPTASTATATAAAAAATAATVRLQ